MEEKERKNKTQGSRSGSYTWLICFIGVILFHPLSFTATAEPPESKDCISYAYTESNNHLFLLATNKSAFGNNITIQHNCEYIEVFINNNFTAYTQEQSLTIPISMGMNNISIYSNNHTNIIENVRLMPDRLSWEFDYNMWLYEDISFDDLIDLNMAEAKENWASFLTAVIIWILVVYVYWNLINSYVDRNYAEEVR